MGFMRDLGRRIVDGFSGLFRSYDAADNRRLNRNWTVYNVPAEQENTFSRDTLRARARDLEQNSDLANAIIQARERNVIGAGYTLQAKTPRMTLNVEIERLWKQWVKARNCDVTGTQSLQDMLRMAVRRKLIDGGVLFRKCFTREGIVRFSLQMIEVDDLDSGKFDLGTGKNRIAGGIEYNEYNRPVAYWFKQYGVNGYSQVDSVRVDAKDVIFYFTKTRPTQFREVSDMAPMLSRIRQANEFVVAVAVKQRIEACLAVFIKRIQQGNPAPGRTTPRPGPDGRVDYAELQLGPGIIKELNAGDEIQVVNPTGQATDASSFLRMFQKMIGSGFGLSYESVTRDLSDTTYSSARQGAIEDELTFAAEREQIEAILDEIYETFLISCYLQGLLPMRDFWENKDKYFAHEWVRKPKPWIDPLKEANADKIALQTGLKTFQQLAAENGMDWQDMADAMAEVHKYGEKIGLDLTGLLYDGKLMTFQDKEEAKAAQMAAATQKEVGQDASTDRDGALQNAGSGTGNDPGAGGRGAPGQ